MDELIQAMSNEDLVAFKAKYPDNASIQTLIDGILATRAKEDEQVKAKDLFIKKIDKLTKDLPHPDDVHNVYLAWKEVDEEVEGAEAEAVELMDGKTEMRKPTTKVTRWVTEVNKGFTVGKGTTSQPTISKRAITLNKRNGQALEFVGNFTSASRACEHLKIPVGGDSATRVLGRDGYILDAYNGTDYLA